MEQMIHGIADQLRQGGMTIPSVVLAEVLDSDQVKNTCQVQIMPAMKNSKDRVTRTVAIAALITGGAMGTAGNLRHRLPPPPTGSCVIILCTNPGKINPNTAVIIGSLYEEVGEGDAPPTGDNIGADIESVFNQSTGIYFRHNADGTIKMSGASGPLMTIGDSALFLCNSNLITWLNALTTTLIAHVHPPNAPSPNFASQQPPPSNAVTTQLEAT